MSEPDAALDADDEPRIFFAGIQEIAEGPCTCFRCGVARAFHAAFPDGLERKDAAFALTVLAEAAGTLLGPADKATVASFERAVAANARKARKTLMCVDCAEADPASPGRAH